MRCFRYMKFEHARQSLRDNLFKVSRLSEFNDPSECRIRLEHSSSVPALRKYIRENLVRLQSEFMRLYADITPDARKRFSEDFIYCAFLASVRQYTSTHSMRLFDDLIMLMCLVKECGLKINADTLFWSHYADSGRGVRITFDLEMRPKSGFYYMREVNYCEDIPAFDVTTFDKWMQGGPFEKYLEEIVCTKGAAWSYENEVRMIIPRKHSVNRPGLSCIQSKEINGERVEFVGIGYEAIKRVDFGPRVNHDEAMAMIDEVKSIPSASHVLFYETCFHESRYAYCYKRIAVNP